MSWFTRGVTGEPREAAAIREALNCVWAGREGTSSYVVGEPARTEALAALVALVAQRDHAERKAALLDGGYERGVADGRAYESDQWAKEATGNEPVTERSSLVAQLQESEARVAELERERDEIVYQRDLARTQVHDALELRHGVGLELEAAEARVAEAEKEERRWYEAFHEHMVRADNAEARVAALTEALRKVKEFASDPFASEIVALRACLLEANEALGLPGPEDSPLRQMAREVLKEMRSEPAADEPEASTP